MLFNSYAYLFAFLPAALAGYFFLGRWREGRYANAWLLFMSLFFYGYWNVLYLPLLCGSIAVNYVLSGYLVKSLQEKMVLRSRLLFGLGLLALLTTAAALFPAYRVSRGDPLSMMED